MKLKVAVKAPVKAVKSVKAPVKAVKSVKAPAKGVKAPVKAVKSVKAPAKAPAKAPDIPTQYSYLRFMTVDELKKLCADRIIKCTGSKNNILTSILKDFEINPPLL